MYIYNIIYIYYIILYYICVCIPKNIISNQWVFRIEPHAISDAAVHQSFAKSGLDPRGFGKLAGSFRR